MLNRLRALSTWGRLNVAGLVVTAAGMILQVAAGSVLYPSLAGPIVLVVTALVVVWARGTWTRWAGLVVPLVLGIGAVAAAGMTGTFVEQLTGVGNIGVLLGSWMHVVGLIGAVAGGTAVLLQPRPVVAA